MGGLPLWKSHHGQLKPVVPLFPQSLETFIFGIMAIFSNIRWFMFYRVLPLSFLEAGGWELCFFCLGELCRRESKGWPKPLAPFALYNYWVTKEVAGCFRGEEDESRPSREQRSEAGAWMEKVTEVYECQIGVTFCFVESMWWLPKCLASLGLRSWDLLRQRPLFPTLET